MPLFQQLPIIGFVAPPLSISHMVLVFGLVMVSNSNTQKYTCTRRQSGSDEEARGVSIHSSSFWKLYGSDRVSVVVL